MQSISAWIGRVKITKHAAYPDFYFEPGIPTNATKKKLGPLSTLFRYHGYDMMIWWPCCQASKANSFLMGYLNGHDGLILVYDH